MLLEARQGVGQTGLGSWGSLFDANGAAEGICQPCLGMHSGCVGVVDGLDAAASSRGPFPHSPAPAQQITGEQCQRLYGYSPTDIPPDLSCKVILGRQWRISPCSKRRHAQLLSQASHTGPTPPATQLRPRVMRWWRIERLPTTAWPRRRIIGPPNAVIGDCTALCNKARIAGTHGA